MQPEEDGPGVTECSAEQLELHALCKRTVVGRFDGGAISSDGGGLLLSKVEVKTRIVERLAEQFVDHRNPEYIEHSVRDLFGQRMFALALGHEDLNDHDRLRLDPLLATVVGKPDPSRQDRLSAHDKGKPLASSRTLNRLELTLEDADAKSRYKKIVADPEGMDRLLVDCFLEAYSEPPPVIWLDLDATDDPLHGGQEGRFFHGYYGHYCLPPAVHLQRRVSAVRAAAPANIDDLAGSVAELERGDSGFCREAPGRFHPRTGQELTLAEDEFAGPEGRPAIASYTQASPAESSVNSATRLETVGAVHAVR